MSEPNQKTRQRSPNDVDSGSHGHTKSQVARPGGPAPPAQMLTKNKLGTVSTTIPGAQGSPLPT